MNLDPAAQAVERGAAVTPDRWESLRSLAWRLDTFPGLAAMFGVALLIRLAIAPRVGFYSDLQDFKIWTGQLAAVGPRRLYAARPRSDYPPGYLYVLWAIAQVSASPGYLLLKLPAMLGDLATAWVAGVFAVRLAPASLRERWPVRALVAAAVLFNPALIALSAVWGQVDVIPVLFVLSSLLMFFTGPQSVRRELAASLLFAVAIAIKPQSGLALPVILYALYRSQLHRRMGWSYVRGSLVILANAAVVLAVWAGSGLEFGLGPTALYRFVAQSAAVYAVTSANAFNLWGFVGTWRDDRGGHVASFVPVSDLRLGAVLFVVAAASVIWRSHRAIETGADRARMLTFAAAITSLLGYTLLTRMHERYMFVALPLFAPLIFCRRLRIVYWALSAFFVLDLWYAFAKANLSLPHPVRGLKLEPLYGWFFGGFQIDTWQQRSISAAFTVVVLFVAWQGFAWLGQPAGPDRRAPAS